MSYTSAFTGSQIDAAVAKSQVIGDFIEAYATAQIETVATAIASITLPAGSWDLSASIAIVGGQVSNTWAAIGISTTSGDLTGLTTGKTIGYFVVNAAAVGMGSLPCIHVNISETTTLYLNSKISDATDTGYGYLSAVRVK